LIDENNLYEYADQSKTCFSNKDYMKLKREKYHIAFLR